MPRFLFQMVFERVRVGMSRQMSFPLNAHLETSSARSTILPSVTLSRSLTRLLTPGSDDLDFFLAIVLWHGLPARDVYGFEKHGLAARATFLFNVAIALLLFL